MTDKPEGGCACGAVRYRLESGPMYVHCCHCTSCQTETGTAFAMNLLIESDRVTLLSGAPRPVMTPSESGKVRKRQGPADLALPRMRDCGLEQLWRRGGQDPLRARRNA